MFWSKEDERQWRDLDAKRKMAEEARQARIRALHDSLTRESGLPRGLVEDVLRDAMNNADKWIEALQPYSKVTAA